MPLTVAGYFSVLLNLILVPVPQCGVTRAEAHLAQFCAALANTGGGSFSLRTKAVITVASVSGWVTPRGQNSLVTGEQCP